MEDPGKRSCKFLHICNIDTQNQDKPLRAKRNLKSVKNGPILKISEIHISAGPHADMPVSYEKNSVQNAGKHTTRKNHEVALVGELTCYITYVLRLLMVNTFSFSYIKVSRKWRPSTSWSANLMKMLTIVFGRDPKVIISKNIHQRRQLR